MNEKYYCKTCGSELIDGKHECKGLWNPKSVNMTAYIVYDPDKPIKGFIKIDGKKYPYTKITVNKDE